MMENLNILELSQNELLSINGGSDCYIGHNETAHNLGRAAGVLAGITVTTALIAFKMVAEKLL